MHICLVNPPLAQDNLYAQWDLSGVDTVCPPLGLLILAATIRNEGHQVSVVDAYAQGYSAFETARRIVESSPDLVGFTATTPAIMGAAATAKLVKEQLPEATVILGGAHATAMAPETLDRFPQFDVLVIGEGDRTILDLISFVADKTQDASAIAGIAFLRDGTVVRTAKRELVHDLDELPLPAWDMLPSLFSPYRMSIVGTLTDKSTAIFTSRGCPGICSFCDTSVFGRKFRAHSAKYVLDMIDILVNKYGIEELLIYDDNFVVDRRRLKEICDGIVDRKYKLHWSCCARVNMVNPEMLAQMRRAGCWQIEYGIESGYPEMLARMNKRITLEQIKQVLTETKRAGIMTRGNFIVGFPGETRESLECTLKFLLDLDLDYFQQTFFTPYPGAAASATAHEWGEVDYEWDRLNNSSINFIPKDLSEKELVDFSKQMFLRFYLRPKVVLAHLKYINSWTAVKRYFRMLKAYMKTVLR